MIPEHLQGNGTYTYDCRKQDCEHCRLMGLTPLPELIFEQKSSEVIYNTPQPIRKRLRTSKTWSGHENRILIENRHNLKGITELLPGRSYLAISQHAHTLKKMGIIHGKT